MNKIPENPYIHTALETLKVHKAKDVIIIHLDKYKTLLDDYLIICTCQSEVQMRAILRKCEKALKESGLKPLTLEYAPGVKWGILKSHEFILHAFEQETREYYSLERLWGDAEFLEIENSDSTKESQGTQDNDEHEFI